MAKDKKPVNPHKLTLPEAIAKKYDVGTGPIRANVAVMGKDGKVAMRITYDLRRITTVKQADAIFALGNDALTRKSS